MNAAGNLSGDLGETDRVRLLRHGHPPNALRRLAAALSTFPTKGSFLELVNRYSVELVTEQ
jgi:hypothetical protein